MSTTNSSPEGELSHESNGKLDGKSMTFRKRRLSLGVRGGDSTEQENMQALTTDSKARPIRPLTMHDSRQQRRKSLDEESENRQRKIPTDPDGDDDDKHNNGNEEEVDEVDYPDASDEKIELDYGYEKQETDYGYESVEDPPSNQHQTLDGDNQSVHSYHSTHSSEADEKAHTFRQRRLSLTATNTGTCHKINSNTLTVAPDQYPVQDNKRQRRLSQDSSACSTNSVNSDGMNSGSGGKHSAHHVAKKPMLFVSRTLHAGELVPHDGMPPPTPTVNSDNLLYMQPALPPLEKLTTHPSHKANASNSSPLTNMLPSRVGGLTQALQPRWKRRKTISHQTEPHKLPFGIEIVGTYSCHGVEPIYDSEGDDEDDEVVIPGGMAGVTMAAKINQDRGGVAYPYANDPKTALFAVYDGHGQGGELVSQYALYEIQRLLEKHISFHSNLPTALKETFIEVDEALKNEPLIEPMFAGTTACVAVYQNSTLTLANAGDSRAVCARRVPRVGSNKQQLEEYENSEKLDVTNGSTAEEYEYIALNLTVDQNPDVPSEMERILRMGGYVSLPPAPGLSARVWLDPHCSQIGLAMARSIGDHAIAPVGVIAEPVITTHEVTSDDDFLILASDGVWEFISSAQAVQIVADNLHRGATRACQALIEAAATRWHEEEGAYRDDITAIVVRLRQLWDNPNIAKELSRIDADKLE